MIFVVMIKTIKIVFKKNNSMEISNDYECPKEAIVPNNCGMAGIYQPNSSDICTEISLVQGFCCYVKLKINNTDSYSCLRVKK